MKRRAEFPPIEEKKKCPVCDEEISQAEAPKHIKKHFSGSDREFPIEPAQWEHYNELKQIEEGEEKEDVDSRCF